MRSASSSADQLFVFFLAKVEGLVDDEEDEDEDEVLLWYLCVDNDSLWTAASPSTTSSGPYVILSDDIRSR